jgi:hypothetical protein
VTGAGVALARWLPCRFSTPGRFRENVALSLGVSGVELGNSILTNLAVPLVASTMAYAGYRTIILYSLFVGALQFGLVNGLYLEALGRPLASVDAGILRRVVGSVALLQLALMPLLGVVLAFIPRLWHYGRMSLVVALVGYGAANVAATYASLWKATGLFRCLTAPLLFARVASLFVLVPALLAGRAPLGLLALSVSAYFAVLALLQHSLVRPAAPLSGLVAPPGTVVRLLRKGFPLYISTLSVSLLFNVDTLAVSMFFPPESFATYAFAFGLASITYMLAESMTAATAFSIVRARRSVEALSDPTFVPYVASLWGGPLLYWAGSVLIAIAYQRFSEGVPLLSVFASAMPFGLLLRSRALAEGPALAREDRLASATGGGLAIVVLSVAAGVAVGRGLRGVAIGWAIGTVLASVLAVRSSGTQSRLLGHAAAASATFISCAMWLTSVKGVALFLGVAVAATAVEVRRAGRFTGGAT